MAVADRSESYIGESILLKDIWGEGILEASLHGMHDLITPNP